MALAKVPSFDYTKETYWSFYTESTQPQQQFVIRSLAGWSLYVLGNLQKGTGNLTDQ